MREEVISQFTGGNWLVAAFVIFFVVFVAFVAWTYRRSGKSYYQRMARMPLDEGDTND
jgi:cbb3-type cytochrome oxidase subunit 3